MAIFYKCVDNTLCTNCKIGNLYSVGFPDDMDTRYHLVDNRGNYYTYTITQSEFNSGFMPVECSANDIYKISTNIQEDYPVTQEFLEKCDKLGFFNHSVRGHNIGNSDYSKHLQQPWSIWQEYQLDPWDADIIKRVLRIKTIPGKTKEEARIEDYQKIIHICKEKLRQYGIQ